MSRPRPYSAHSRSAARPEVIDRAVYGTIVVTSVLVVYDGWSKLKLGDANMVILDRLVAMVIGMCSPQAWTRSPNTETLRGATSRCISSETNHGLCSSACR
jgi:hypothetical protein